MEDEAEFCLELLALADSFCVFFRLEVWIFLDSVGHVRVPVSSFTFDWIGRSSQLPGACPLCRAHRDATEILTCHHRPHCV